MLEFKENILKHITASIGKEINGKFGAVANSNKDCANDYWIVEWENLPYFEGETKEMVYGVNWMYSLEYTPHWYRDYVD